MTFTNWPKKELINYDISRYPVAVIILYQNNKITLPRKKVGPDCRQIKLPIDLEGHSTKQKQRGGADIFFGCLFGKAKTLSVPPLSFDVFCYVVCFYQLSIFTSVDFKQHASLSTNDRHYELFLWCFPYHILSAHNQTNQTPRYKSMCKLLYCYQQKHLLLLLSQP